jgi:hypothetical protein
MIVFNHESADEQSYALFLLPCHVLAFSGRSHTDSAMTGSHCCRFVAFFTVKITMRLSWTEGVCGGWGGGIMKRLFGVACNAWEGEEEGEDGIRQSARHVCTGVRLLPQHSAHLE